MTDQYRAWDGNDYPWPPPEGWTERSDGQYWPEGTGPVDKPPPPVVTPPPMPPVPSTPPPAPGMSVPPPGAPPPGIPAGHSSSGVHAPPAAKKSSKTGWWVLGILLGFLVLVVAGCAVLFAVVGQGIEETGEVLGEFADQTERRADAAQAIAVQSCEVDGGQPRASGTVTNSRGDTSSYFIEIEFYDTATNSLLGTGDVRIDDVGPGDREEWEVLAPTSGFEGSVRCDRGFDTIRIQD